MADPEVSNYCTLVGPALLTYEGPCDNCIRSLARRNSWPPNEQPRKTLQQATRSSSRSSDLPFLSEVSALFFIFLLLAVDLSCLVVFGSKTTLDGFIPSYASIYTCYSTLTTSCRLLLCFSNIYSKEVSTFSWVHNQLRICRRGLHVPYYTTHDSMVETTMI